MAAVSVVVGQPRVKLPMADKAREARIASLYTRDAEVQVKQLVIIQISKNYMLSSSMANL